MFIRFFLDVICWTAVTIVALVYVGPIPAALIGATGLMYLGWCVKKILSILRMAADAEAAVVLEEQSEQLLRFWLSIGMTPDDMEHYMELVKVDPDEADRFIDEFIERASKRK